MNWRDLIEFRAPYQTAYFKGTNTRVLRLMLCLANGWTETQILIMHPEISIEHIKACVMYGAECIDSQDAQINPQLIEMVGKSKRSVARANNASTN